MTEILETFPQVFCFPKSCISDDAGKISTNKLVFKFVHENSNVNSYVIK